MHPVCAGILGSSLLAGAMWTAAAGQAAPERTVQAQMRNVAFHVDSTAVLAIHYARGDKHSFVLDLDTARIGISPAALGLVLNATRSPIPARRSGASSSPSTRASCASTDGCTASRSTWWATCP